MALLQEGKREVTKATSGDMPDSVNTQVVIGLSLRRFNLFRRGESGEEPHPSSVLTESRRHKYRKE